MKGVFIIALILCIFTDTVAQEKCDTLDNVTIYSGKKKHKRLLGKGTRFPGGVTQWTPDKLGAEVGSVINVKHPFEVEEILFSTQSNNIDSLKLKIDIRRTEKLDSSILEKPIEINIPKGEKQKFGIIPEKQLIIEPGEYFVAVVFADCHSETKRRWNNDSNYDGKQRDKILKECILFPLYFKASYTRSGKGEELEKIPVNLGLKVRGIEYR